MSNEIIKYSEDYSKNGLVEQYLSYLSELPYPCLPNKKAINTTTGSEPLIAEIENILERYLMGREDAYEAIEKIKDIFFENDRLAWFNKPQTPENKEN